MIKVFLLSALLLPSALPAEEFTMDTYYPSPVGVYNNVTVTSTTALASDGGYVVIGARKSDNPHQLRVEGSAGFSFVEMEGYTDANILAASLKPGESRPLPGRLLFNKDKNKFYYTSVDAVASDRSTWLLPLSGFDADVVAESESTANFPLVGDYRFVRPLRFIVGTAVGSPPTRVKLLSNASGKLVKSGFYVMEAKGKFCSTANPARVRIAITYYISDNDYNAATMDEEMDLTSTGGCYEYNMGGMVYLRAGQQVSVGTRAKRGVAGDYIQSGAKVKVERVLSF